MGQKCDTGHVTLLAVRTIHTTMDGPATRTEKKGRDKAKSHGTPYSAKHARLAAAAAAATAKEKGKAKGKEKK